MNVFKLPYQIQFIIYAFLLILNTNETSCEYATNSTPAGGNGTCLENPKMVTFFSLKEYQESDISFRYSTSRGNHVNFTMPRIDRLLRNIFLSKYGHWVMGLHLNSKNISSIEPGTLNAMTCLSVLDLSNNSISVLKRDVFRGSPRLKTINLSKNRIYVLRHYVFDNLNLLKNLDLSHNNIREIEGAAFANLHSMEVLRLNNNFLRMISYNTFIHMTQLNFLDLANNSLLYVLYTEEKYLKTSLLSLNLTHNCLHDLPKNLALDGLSELNLDHNCFRDLDVFSLKANFKNLKFIGIEHNIWSCQKLLNVHELLMYYKIQFDPELSCSFDYFQRNEMETSWIPWTLLILFAIPSLMALFRADDLYNQYRNVLLPVAYVARNEENNENGEGEEQNNVRIDAGVDANNVSDSVTRES